MNILFDECVPKRLRSALTGHNVQTVQECGWAGVKNGELLKKASESFDVLLTVDRNLAFQQNATTLPLPVVVIHSTSNRLKDLPSRIPNVLELLRVGLAKKLHLIR